MVRSSPVKRFNISPSMTSLQLHLVKLGFRYHSLKAACIESELHTVLKHQNGSPQLQIHRQCPSTSLDQLLSPGKRLRAHLEVQQGDHWSQTRHPSELQIVLVHSPRPRALHLILRRPLLILGACANQCSPQPQPPPRDAIQARGAQGPAKVGNFWNFRST